MGPINVKTSTLDFSHLLTEEFVLKGKKIALITGVLSGTAALIGTVAAAALQVYATAATAGVGAALFFGMSLLIHRIKLPHNLNERWGEKAREVDVLEKQLRDANQEATTNKDACGLAQEELAGFRLKLEEALKDAQSAKDELARISKENLENSKTANMERVHKENGYILRQKDLEAKNKELTEKLDIANETIQKTNILMAELKASFKESREKEDKFSRERRAAHLEREAQLQSEIDALKKQIESHKEVLAKKPVLPEAAPPINEGIGVLQQDEDLETTTVAKSKEKTQGEIKEELRLVFKEVDPTMIDELLEGYKETNGEYYYLALEVLREKGAEEKNKPPLEKQFMQAIDSFKDKLEDEASDEEDFGIFD